LNFFALIGIIVSLSLFINNYTRFENPLGNEAQLKMHRNPDHMIGAISNFSKYIFQTITPAKEIVGENLIKKISGPFDSLWKKYGQVNAPHLTLKTGSDVLLRYGSVIPNENASLFGPIASILVFPALLFSLISRNRYFITISFLMLSYLFAVSYSVTWMVWNTRFLSLFFAGSGITIIFLLAQFKDKKYFNALISTIFIIAFINAGYVTCCNSKKVLFTPQIIMLEEAPYKVPVRYSPWIYQVKDRNNYFKSQFGNNLAYDQFKNSLNNDDKILFIARGRAILYPIFNDFYHHILDFSNGLSINNKNNNKVVYSSSLSKLKHDFDYIIFLNSPPPGLINKKFEKIVFGRRFNNQIFAIYKTK
ncbi:MAG: hypothetical protein ACOCWG_05660, partial [bacterium]